MDYKQIQELIKMVNKSAITELSVKDGEFEIKIKQGGAGGSSTPQMMAYAPQPQMMMPQPQQAPQASSTPAAALSPAVQDQAPAAAEAPKASGGKSATIKSPMIGTFYRSSSPDKPPMVSVGDEVKTGDVLCIIEAMKLFNEIESEQSGRIVRVLVDDASPVEYDQPLFEIEAA